MSDEPEGMTCRSYTHARRHPQVVGVIGGHVMPFPSTNAQLGAFICAAIVLLKTRFLWATFIPTVGQIIIVVGLPVGAWWAVRFWHPEGREPFKAVIGGFNYALRPRLGSLDGRSVHRHRPYRPRGSVFYLGDVRDDHA